MTSPTRTVMLAAAIALVAGACGHEPQMRRLRNEFEAEASRGNLASAALLQQRMLEMADADYGPMAEATIELRSDLATTYGWAGQSAPALAIAEDDLRRIEQSCGAGDRRTLAPRFAIAWTLVAARQWSRAEEEAARIAELCHGRRPGVDRRERCRRDLDDLYMALGDSRRANAEFLLAEQSAIQGEDPHSLLPALTLVGRRYAETGDLPEARWYLRRCVAEARRLPRRDGKSAARRAWSDAGGDIRLDVVDSAHAFDSQAPRCLDDLIDVERRTGNTSEADSLSQWRRESWRQGPELEHELRERVRIGTTTWHDEALTAWDLDTLGWYLLGKGRPSAAVDAWTQADGLLERLRNSSGRHRDGATAWRHADVLLGLASASLETGRSAAAAEACRRASSIAEAEFHPLHAWRLEALACLAVAELRQQNAAAAETTWRRYLDIAAESRGPDHADFVRGLDGLADVRRQRGDEGGAQELRARAARIRERYRDGMEAVTDLPLPPSLRSPPSPATDPPTENRPPSP